MSGTGKADLENDGLSLEVGEVATIILKQNLSTGYSWMLNDDLLDDGVVTVTEDNKSGANPRGFVGVPGTKVITLSGLSAGTATLQAVMVRPWEFDSWDSDIDSADNMTIEITVGGADEVIGSEYVIDSPSINDDYDYGYSSPSSEYDRGYSSYYPVKTSSYPSYDSYGRSYSSPSYGYDSGSYNRYPT